MPRYAALLRGVNVGGRGMLAMATLRELLLSLGHTDVATYLQSGNAVFGTKSQASPRRLARDIETALHDRAGLDVRVLLRTRDELQQVVDGNPLADVATHPSRFLVIFLDDRPEPGRARAIDPVGFGPDRFAVRDREVYVWCPEGLSKTKLTHAFFEKQLGVAATGRNWNTVRALLALMS